MPPKSSSASPSGKKQPAAETAAQAAVPADWHWFLQALDQKLEDVRARTGEMIDRFHQFELSQQQLDQSLSQQMHQHRLDLQNLEQSLHYLSHKTQLQLKDSEKATERFMHETERKVADFHFAAREELSTLSRRIEILEKLLL